MIQKLINYSYKHVNKLLHLVISMVNSLCNWCELFTQFLWLSLVQSTILCENIWKYIILIYSLLKVWIIWKYSYQGIEYHLREHLTCTQLYRLKKIYTFPVIYTYFTKLFLVCVIILKTQQIKCTWGMIKKFMQFFLI